jgi:hypothetical protein
MTFINAELESTTLEIEIDACEIVQDAACEIEEIVDDTIDSKDLVSRDDVEDMIEKALKAAKDGNGKALSYGG